MTFLNQLMRRHVLAFQTGDSKEQKDIAPLNCLGYENMYARSCFKKSAALFVVTDYWFDSSYS